MSTLRFPLSFKPGLIALAAVAMALPSCETYTKRGALVGGLGGAAIGGIAGGRKGALIGGAAGAIGGAVLGDMKDRRHGIKPAR